MQRKEKGKCQKESPSNTISEERRSEKMQEINDFSQKIFNADTPEKDEIHKVDEKTSLAHKKLQNLLLQIQTLLALKHMREDKTPIEVIENLYIGSIGAALSKEELKKNGISHIVCASSQIKEAFPKVTR